MINKLLIVGVILVSAILIYFLNYSSKIKVNVSLKDCHITIPEGYNIEYVENGLDLYPNLNSMGVQYYFVTFIDDNESSNDIKNIIEKMNFTIKKEKILGNLKIYTCIDNSTNNEIYYIVGKRFYISFVSYDKIAKNIIKYCNESWKEIGNTKINEFMIEAVQKKLSINREDAIKYLEMLH